MVGDKKCWCSGLRDHDGGCEYGHVVTQGCYGVGYPSGKIVPVCVLEDMEFDEVRMAVTNRPYNGD